MPKPLNINGRIFGDAGDGVIESTKESVQYALETGDKGRGAEMLLVFKSVISKPQPEGTQDCVYLPGGPTKVEWMTFVWGKNGQVGAWGAQLNPAGVKFPWSQPSEKKQ